MTIDDGSWQYQRIFLPTGLALAGDLYSATVRLGVEDGRGIRILCGIQVSYGWH
jgi:hypothetical protein